MAILPFIIVVLQATSQITTAVTSEANHTTKPPLLASTEYVDVESGATLPDNEGFPCPKECTCLPVTNPPFVRVACAIHMLGFGINFSVFNETDYPSRLLLFCNNALVASVLDDEIFAGLHAFNYLKIKDCRITNVSSHAFKGMTSLKTLIIEGAQDTEFDPGCLQEPDLSNLEVVSITGTNTKLVPSMCNLDKLWMANISHNGIEEFANTGLVCNKPTNIEMIDISDNKLHNLATDFGEITNNLRLLSASNNRIGHISSSIFSHMMQLEVVQLDNNGIFTFPSDVFYDNSKITTLSLSHNYIWKMPEGLFSNLENLEFLRLEAIYVTLGYTIWTSLANLTELKVLYLGDNTHITNFSTTTLQNLKKLQILDVSGNSINSIQNGTFENQNQMLLLNISDNYVRTIESGSFEGLTKLTTLDLKHNEIMHIHYEALLPLVSLLTLNLSYNSIQEVPHLPESLQLLDLRHNDITFVDQNSFTGLVDLKGINMRFNKLKFLPKNVFITNKNLQLLELSYNNITEIEYQSFPKQSKLEVLILNNNKITDIVVSFAPEYFSNLKTLDISHNFIERLMPPMLGGLFPSSIEELFLSWNHIKELGNFIFRLPDLRVVDLKGNNISSMSNLVLEIFPDKLSPVTFYLSSNPFDCDCNLVWLKEVVRKQGDILHTIPYIIRDFSALFCQRAYRHRHDLLVNIPADKFLCTYPDNCLARCPGDCCSRKYCACRTYCPVSCTCYRSRNWGADVIDCLNANLTSIPEKVSPMVTTFDLSGNYFPALEPNKFENLTRLTELQLQFCGITVLHEDAFDGLVNLTILDLGHNLLTSLKPSMFRRVTKLKTLILHGNKINFISEKTFEHLPALSYLDLSANNLNKISGYEFKSMSSVRQLKLASNPWSCDCRYLERMKNFTITHAHKILDFDDVTCARQNSTYNILEKYPLADVHLPDFCDNETVIYNHTSIEIDRLSKSAIAAMSTVLSITFLGLIAFGIIFWKREFLKVWCFVKFGWKFTGTEKKDDASRPYDAFVSYSSHDEDFIVRELTPYLEEERQGRPGYRLCVHYRDFAVGASIAESIISAVELSKRVIIVLSDNFLRSEWCQYEFQTAHHQLLEERKNRIIMVLLHDINLDMDDHQLKNYLKTRTYLKYGDPWFWAKLEYGMPKKAVHIGEDMAAGEAGPQPIIEPENVERQDITLGDDFIDDDMQYIIDNMRNYEADDPKLYAFEVEIDQ